jgi:hypothetical protein
VAAVPDALRRAGGRGALVSGGEEMTVWHTARSPLLEPLPADIWDDAS